MSVCRDLGDWIESNGSEDFKTLENGDWDLGIGTEQVTEPNLQMFRIVWRTKHRLCCPDFNALVLERELQVSFIILN